MNNTPYYNMMKNDGREIVIISNNERADSAIFYAGRGGTIYSFNRSFGLMDRPDLTPERFEKHIEKMKQENSTVIIRGCR